MTRWFVAGGKDALGKYHCLCLVNVVPLLIQQLVATHVQALEEPNSLVLLLGAHGDVSNPTNPGNSTKNLIILYQLLNLFGDVYTVLVSSRAEKSFWRFILKEWSIKVYSPDHPIDVKAIAASFTPLHVKNDPSTPPTVGEASDFASGDSENPEACLLLELVQRWELVEQNAKSKSPSITADAGRINPEDIMRAWYLREYQWRYALRDIALKQLLFRRVLDPRSLIPFIIPIGNVVERFNELFGEGVGEVLHSRLRNPTLKITACEVPRSTSSNPGHLTSSSFQPEPKTPQKNLKRKPVDNSSDSDEPMLAKKIRKSKTAEEISVPVSEPTAARKIRKLQPTEDCSVPTALLVQTTYSLSRKAAESAPGSANQKNLGRRKRPTMFYGVNHGGEGDNGGLPD